MTTLISDELRWAADQIINHSDYPSAVLSGLAPNREHLESGGFHVSIEDLIAYGNGVDYSNTRAGDRGLNPQYGAAFDISMSKADMIRAYGRVHAVWADDSDPRRRYVNAINGWDGSGDAVRLDFDAGVAMYASPDHQWHNHGEIHRRWVRDMTAMRAVVSIYRGEPKALWLAQAGTEEADVPFADEKIKATKTTGVELFSPAKAEGAEVAAATVLQLSAIHARRAALSAAAADAKLNQVLTQLAALSGRDFTDELAIVAGVLAGLEPAAIAAAIPQELARQVADELAARLGS